MSTVLLQTKSKSNRVLDLFKLFRSEVAQFSLGFARVVEVRLSASNTQFLAKNGTGIATSNRVPWDSLYAVSMSSGAIGVESRDVEHEARTCLGGVSEIHKPYLTSVSS